MRSLPCGRVLPAELKTYLDELRRTKERALAATRLDDWAREDASPSQEEIARAKHLA